MNIIKPCEKNSGEMEVFMKIKVFHILWLTIWVFGLSTAATGQDISAETKSEVPELTAFHEVIYPIWHTAYPEKDYDALRSFVFQINNLAGKLYGAKLPGILREKEDKWKAGMVDLKQSVDEYNAAASGTDDALLLNAAENLHAKYESLVRLIRPVLKEMDEFHRVLYMIYHKYLPGKEYDMIRAVSDDILDKAELVTKAVLPRRLESKAGVFQLTAEELFEETKALAVICRSDDVSALEKSVEKVHSKYLALVKIFENP
jgi:hypothetical protein